MNQRQKSIKESIAWTAATLLIYNALVYFMMVFILSWLVKSFTGNEVGGSIREVAFTLLNNTDYIGIAYLINLPLGLLLFQWYRKGKLFKEDWKAKGPRKMNWKVFVVFLSFFGFSQLFFALYQTGLENLLNQYGLTISTATESATLQGDHSWSMLLYAWFLGPIFEELVFRGAILSQLKKYGSVFAIIMSSVFFGFFHQNPVQIPFAFMIGLVMAYVALEYGILWTMIFHIINNFGLEQFSRLLQLAFGEEGAESAYFVLLVLASVISLLVLLIKRKEIGHYLREHRADKGTYPAVLRSVWFWIFILLTTHASLVYITPLLGK